MSARAGVSERTSERASRTRRMAREASLSLSSSTTTASWSSSSASRNGAVALVVGGTGTSGCEVAAELVRRSRQERQAQEGARGRFADLGKVAVLSRNVRKEDVATREDADDVEVLAVRANLQERRSIAEALREADATQVKHVFWFVEASRARGMADPILMRMQLATMARLQILVRLGLALLPSMASTWYFGYLAQRAGSGPGGGTVGWMENLLGALVDVGASVESFVLCTGGKHYGMHLGPGVWPGYATPFCEDVHRCPGPLSYFEQEDFLKKRALKDGFSLTVLRPSFIVGTPAALATSTMSLALVLGMYTSILKYQGKRLVFPGSQDCWTARLQLVTSKKIAEVAVWATSREKCQRSIVESEEEEEEKEDDVMEAYNLVSCPPFTWRACWDSLAASLKMDACGPTSLFGCTALSALGGTEEARRAWRDLSLKHSLRQDVDLWSVFEAGFLDKALTCGWDCEFSSRKLAAAGFPRDRVLESLDAACILRSAFADLCAARILPSFSDI